MPSFSEFAQKKVAGIPVLYVAGAFVVILAIVAYKMKPSTPASTDNGPVDETQTSSDQADVSAYSGLKSNGTVTVVQEAPAQSEAVRDDNDKWERSAITYLIEEKLATPSDAQSAIHHYLEGANLSFDEGKLKDAAIRKLGLPPEPLAGIGTVGTAPAQKQFSMFPGTHTVKGVNDNSASKLATLYYGNGDASHTARIVAANYKLGPSGASYNVGTKVTIPVWTNPRYFTITQSTRYPSQVAAKNGISYDAFINYNPGLTAPYKVGSKVRVG